MPKSANQIRIIGGRHRGRKLSFIPVKHLRPTPDRVRETLFNWLQFDIAGARCLDLFAGSGALGIEALSRSAAEVVFIEQAKAAAKQLRDNLQLCGETEHTKVMQADAFRLLAERPDAAFDVVFIDPPFADRRLQQILQALENNDWLADDAWIYVEQDSSIDWPELPNNWTEHRVSKAGQSSQKLLRRSNLA